MKFELIPPDSVPNKVGRPSLYGRPLPGWVKFRRWRERKTGISDPVLLRENLSTFEAMKNAIREN